MAPQITANAGNKNFHIKKRGSVASLLLLKIQTKELFKLTHN
ncbi:hypothetical protein YPPY66_3863, partial [Yersinia pestis PY-66]